MKKLLLAGLIGFTAISCAPLNQIPLKSRELNSVELNTELSNDIGDVLIEKGKEEYQEAVKITNCPDRVSFGFGMLKYPYSIGDVLPLTASDSSWFLYDGGKVVPGQNYSFGIAIHKTDKAIVRPYCYNQTNGGLNVRFREDFAVQMTTYNKSCQECFKQEFIFNGKVGNNLKFIYREFISDFARPAFTQELQYDLNESNVIGFKGLRIEIIKASNTNIKYKVLSTFQNR